VSRWLGTVRAALLAPANVLGLASAGGASLVTGQATPALVALAVEAFYLLLVAVSPPLRRALRGERVGRGSDEVRERLAELAENQREHYFVLCDLKDKVLANYRKLPGGGVLAASSEPRIDALLTAFLRLLCTLNDHRKYLGVADREAVQRELRSLESELATEPNHRLREVQQKRADILRKRLQRFTLADESRAVVSHQLAGIEELIRLTHEQSIAIRDPASVTETLDALAAEVTATEETVREMERFLQVSEELASSPSHRPRVRG
jgi:hypothetical protein